MCDFCSIIVRADGAVFHKPHNSHSQMVREAEWAENAGPISNRGEDIKRRPYVECEWNGDGEYQSAWHTLRAYTRTFVKPEDLTDAQVKSIDNFYGMLVRALGNPFPILFESDGPWNGPDYDDVRDMCIMEFRCKQRKFSVSEQIKIAKRENVEAKRLLAGSDVTSIPALKRLSQDANDSVRGLALCNRKLGDYAARRLRDVPGHFQWQFYYAHRGRFAKEELVEMAETFKDNDGAVIRNILIESDIPVPPLPITVRKGNYTHIPGLPKRVAWNGNWISNNRAVGSGYYMGNRMVIPQSAILEQFRGEFDHGWSFSKNDEVKGEWDECVKDSTTIHPVAKYGSTMLFANDSVVTSVNLKSLRIVCTVTRPDSFAVSANGSYIIAMLNGNPVAVIYGYKQLRKEREEE